MRDVAGVGGCGVCGLDELLIGVCKCVGVRFSYYIVNTTFKFHVHGAKRVRNQKSLTVNLTFYCVLET